CVAGLLDTENRLEHGLGPVSTREVVRFSLEGVRGVADAAQRFGCPVLRGRVSRLPSNETERVDLTQSARILSECGAGVERDPSGSVRVTDDALVDVRALHAGLLRSLPDVRPTTPVTALRVGDDGVVAETPAGAVRAEIAVLANGPRVVEL